MTCDLILPEILGEITPTNLKMTGANLGQHICLARNPTGAGQLLLERCPPLRCGSGSGKRA